MKFSLSLSLPQQTARPLLQIPNMNNIPTRPGATAEDKIVVVMGATGAGKSCLSIDLATYFGGEVINSDKMQVFRGLDVTTNKITDEERRGVPHHVFDFADPVSEFTAGNFRAMTNASLKSIIGRGSLPIIVGGSNSYIEALIDSTFRSKYNCCFLWVDVAMPVLHSNLSSRVDKMVQRGMVEEVRDFYQPNGDYSRGVLKSIGVPEFDYFFRYGTFSDEEERARMLEEALDAVKMNTSKLACRQVEKIRRLKNVMGWRLHRLDATEVVKKRREEAEAEAEAEVAWSNKVSGPATAMVSSFLHGGSKAVRGGGITEARRAAALPLMAATATATATAAAASRC